jgi:hypothetical protein
MTFLECPAYMNEDGTRRCALPAAMESRYTIESSDGPLEGAKIRCPLGHWFNGAIESLTWDRTRKLKAPPVILGSHAGRERPEHRRDNHYDDSRSAPWNTLDGPNQNGRRPNTAPPYYLGRPAALWLTAMCPRRRRSAAVTPPPPLPEAGTSCVPEQLSLRHAHPSAAVPAAHGGAASGSRRTG